MATSDDTLTPTAVTGDSLWLALYFPHLALDVFELSDDTRAVAIVEQRRVHCANRDNLSAGLALATARALHPELLALERSPEREHDHLQRLAHWAYRLTPGVVIAARNSLLLEIGSCQRLYRGVRNILTEVCSALQQRQQHAQPGLARTPKAAWLLAQCNSKPAVQGDRVNDAKLRRQLAAVAVTTLETDRETQRALKQMGLDTLGALHDLPAAALGKRFGAGFVDYLQQIHGDSPDPQTFFTPAPHFQHGLAFIDGIAQRQMLLFPMKRLLQALDDYLHARQLQCHTLHWQLFDAHRLRAEFSLELSRTQHRRHDLLELSRIKLERMALPAAVFSIGLTCTDFFEAAPTAQSLFPDSDDRREAAAALRDRLHARLGQDAMLYAASRESHWPEHAGYLSAKPIAPTTTIGASPRPLWLLPQPQPLRQHNDLPCWPAPLTLLRGPERIGNPWWQQDENSERDYYIARNTRGITCWVYCECTTRCWFLHGLFA